MVQEFYLENKKERPSLSSDQIRQLADVFFAITTRALEKDQKRFPKRRDISLLKDLLDLDYSDVGDNLEKLEIFYERCYPKMERALREANVWETDEHSKLYDAWLLGGKRKKTFDEFVSYFLEKVNKSEPKYGGKNIHETALGYLQQGKAVSETPAPATEVSSSVEESTKEQAPVIPKESASHRDLLLSLEKELVFTDSHMEVIDGLDLEATTLPLIKHNEYPSLPSLPKNERIIPSDEIMKNRNRLETLRLSLFEKQENLAKFGLLSGMFKSKKKNSLVKEIEELQKNIVELESNNKINEIRFFVKERSSAFDLRVEHSQEEKPKAPIKKLFAFYEKFFMKKLLPEKWRVKLEKQGFLGKVLANGCTLNTAIGFSLLGGGLALGGASIVGASMLSGRRLLSGTATGVGSYNLLKLGSNAYAKTHGWDKQLGSVEIKGLSLEQTIKYLAHYEANALLEGRKTDGDLYYGALINHFSNILEEGKSAFVREEDLKFDDKAWQTYVIAQVKEIDINLEQALKEKHKRESHLKSASVLLGIAVGSGLFQKAISHLFNLGGTSAPAVESVGATNDVSVAETLLTEQEISNFPKLPETNFDFLTENKIDQSVFPELASENLPSAPSADAFLGDDVYQSPQSAVESMVELPEQTAGMLKQSFIESHPLIESAGGDISVVGDKIKVVFDIKVGGDFELKQQALRRIMVDVFPVEEVKILKNYGYGLSALDIGRIESNVATFTRLLEAKPFHGFDPSLVKDIIKMDGNQLVILDYDRLEKISSGVLKVSKAWVPDASSGFVRVAKNTNEKIWESILNTKLQNIKI